ncbi:MAG TPA: hypothetical protein DCX06_00565 [Opitutae bacterium]|nr:hypothetical protein [Opitutae bacterium]
MSARELRIEMGKPQSTLEKDGVKTLTYVDGKRYVFHDDALHSINGVPLNKASAAASPASPSPKPKAVSDPLAAGNQPILGTEPAIEPLRETPNISETMEPTGDTLLGSDYEQAQEGLDYTYQDYDDDAYYDVEPPTPQERALAIILTFIFETIVVFIVLKLAFHFTGFPALWRQLVLLSLTVAFASTVINIILPAEFSGLIDDGLGFFILMIMVRQLTDVREWTTAISIAVAATVVKFILGLLLINVFLIFLGRLM